MAEEEEPQTLDYQRMVHDALRDVARQALAQVAAWGIPGEHQLFIGFRTDAPGVEMPAFLRDAHPQEMSVVLQRQFWDLEVDHEAFSVSLAFGGSRRRLTVPFAAVTTFADPSVPFGLRFLPPGADLGELEKAEAGDETAEPESTATGDGEDAGDDNIVRFDRFRKKD